MVNLPLQILLVEDSPTDVLLLEEALEEVRPLEFALTCVERIDKALHCLDNGCFDAVLLDLSLPDSQGLEGFVRIQKRHSSIPILVLTGLNDEAVAVQMVQNGAQDYLVKGVINGKMLARTIRYAIERKRFALRLRDSETGYRRLFETAQDGIFILDGESGKITDANPYIGKLLGFEVSEFIGKRLWEIGPFRDKAASQVAFRTLQEHGYIRYEDLPLMKKDGGHVNVEFVSNIYLVGDQQVVQCNIRDITERKRADEALRRQASLLEQSYDAILIWEIGGPITYWNQGAALLYGFTKTEAIGRIHHELLQTEHTLSATQFEEELKRVGRWEGELRQTTRDGRKITVESRHVVVYEDGRPTYVLETNRNITERKEAEAQAHYQQALLEAQSETSLDGILVVSDAGKILSYNQRYIQLCAIPLHVIASGDDMLMRQAVLDRFVNSRQLLERVEYLYEHREERSYEELPLHDGRIFDRYSAPITSDKGTYFGRVWYFRDITERKRAEEKLRESEQRFQNIVANTPGTVYQLIFHPDGSVEIPFVNERCRELFEMGPEELQLHPTFPAEVTHPADRPEQERSVAESMKTLMPWNCEWRIQLPSGKTKWVHGASIPQRLPDGGTLWDGLLMDITARKEAEEERDRFFTLSLDILCIASPLGYFTRLNPAIEGILGFSSSELRARPFMDFVHPDDVPATLAVVEQLNAGIAAIGFENRYLCSDGSYKWLTWTAVPHDGLLYCVGHDITSLKRAEEELRHSFDELEMRVAERTAALAQTNAELHLQKTILESQGEASTDGILVVSNTGQIMSYNRRFVEMWQIPSEVVASRSHELMLKSVLDKLHEPQDFLDKVAYLYQHSDEKSHDEILRNNGGILDRYSAPFKTDDGANYGRIWFFRDITERRQAETALQQAKEEADTANRAKSEFLSRMSHELRTPLNAILGFGQILDKQDLDPLSQESIGYILKGGRHLLDLINEVLDIARVEAGHIELSLEPIALDDIVPDACALVRPLAVERCIRLEENTLEWPGSHILADRQRIKQVLINLLSNAIKYNREGGLVEVSCEQKPDGWTAIAVRDTGPGIAPQDLPKLFTPFERLGAGASAIEGTGLGLVLSQRLVTAMCGNLKVESTLGWGTTFTLEFPQTTSAKEQLTNLPEATYSVDTIKENERLYNVLCIEDNPSNLRLIEAILRRRPEITLLAAMQGSIGLDLARQHEPDLILLDLNLPDITGHEVLARLQQSALTRDIPVIVISADATPKQIERLLAAGARAYLTKPLDVGQFLLTLDKFLLVAPAMVTQFNDAEEVQ